MCVCGGGGVRLADLTDQGSPNLLARDYMRVLWRVCVGDDRSHMFISPWVGGSPSWTCRLRFLQRARCQLGVHQLKEMEDGLCSPVTSAWVPGQGCDWRSGLTRSLDGGEQRLSKVWAWISGGQQRAVLAPGMKQLSCD